MFHPAFLRRVSGFFPVFFQVTLAASYPEAHSYLMCTPRKVKHGSTENSAPGNSEIPIIGNHHIFVRFHMLNFCFFCERDVQKGVSKNSGIPKWMVKIMENPSKMDDLVGKPTI